MADAPELGWFREARLRRVLNYADARRFARQTLPRSVFDYVDGGAEDEVTLARNRAAFQALALRTRVGESVPSPSLETGLFGDPVALPVLLGPCGGLRLVHPEGDLGAARAAAACGAIHVAASAAGFSLEQIATTAPGQKWFQLYRHGGRAGMENMVERAAQEPAYRALVVTMDTQVAGRREKDTRNGFRPSSRITPSTAARMAPQCLLRPFWTARYVRDGMPFEMANTAVMRHSQSPLTLSDLAAGPEPPSPTWSELSWIREHWDRALVVKGLLSAEDARHAHELGCDGVIVSNHGGRQLDSAPATLAVLPEIVTAVGDDMTVLVDSGVRRGTDVLKALALGAKAVLIGRSYVWGLAIGGQAGVEQVLGQLGTEMRHAMRLMGVRSVSQLDASWLTDVPGDQRLAVP